MADQSVSYDEKYLRLAIAEAQKSLAVPSAYCVGCVIIDSRNETVLSTGYSREIEGNTHAEECALIKLNQKFNTEFPSQCSSPSQINGTTEISTSIIANLDGSKKYRWHPQLLLLAPHLTLYTTMEPCSNRLSGNISCTTHILDTGIKRVVLGIKEPDHFVKCTGVSTLLDNGVKVVHVKGLEKQCWEPNRHIREEY
ncbi:cytidine deaminase-like protein [Paraphysoderma sedebokerense]|nr:cytidine deaminase-like protein [Paraphysoderma sedebokerense]KAI9143566.1 cytidine deaminase-like protein [Paraphysoderma sedebokerense]